MVRVFTMRAAGALFVGLVCWNTSLAQVYRCSSPGGTYLSDRPCNGGGTPPPTVSIRSVPAPPAPSVRFSHIPSVSAAPDHLKYLSAECAEMNDGLRTGPARGVGGSTLAQLRSNYQKRCGEEEQEAYNRLGQDQARARSERKTQQAALQLEQQRAVTAREQCSEMLRILHGKRQRLDGMSPGERTDHERFEANYKSRCVGG